MPGRDGTGPMGLGSRTGRGMGNCPGGNSAGNDNNVQNGGGFFRGICRGLRIRKRTFSGGQRGGNGMGRGMGNGVSGGNGQRGGGFGGQRNGNFGGQRNNGGNI